MQEHEHIDNETPKHWPKHMPFRLPEHYFTRQRKKILQALEHERIGMPAENLLVELERISPLLGELKRQGINGRWNDRHPEYKTSLDPKQVDTETDIIQIPVKPMKKTWGWVAAAALTGILLTGVFLIYRPVQKGMPGQEPSLSGLISDTVGFSDEDIRSYLAETMDLPAVTPHKITAEKSQEVYLASADMLKSPELFTVQMESISMDELEAYINDVPSLKD